MLRYGLRAFYITLAAGCIYFLYSTVSGFLGAPEVREVRIPAIEPAPRSKVDFARYAIVGERNLFKSREVALPPPPPPKEELEESKLRYRLLGTIAGTRPGLSIATLQDESTKERFHVRVDDPIGDAPNVTVARIERMKLVINNKGRLEAITMEEPESTTKPSRASPRKRAKPRTSRARRPRGRPAANSQRERLLSRVRGMTDKSRGAKQSRPQPRAARKPDKKASNDVKNLLDQVRFAPSYDDDGELAGVQVTEVLPGTPLEQSGLQSGDVIVSINGVPINGPSDLPKILPALHMGERSCLQTVGPDGTEETHCWDN